MRRRVNRALGKYSYGLLGGLIGIILADRFFPALDHNIFLIAGVLSFFLPVLYHLISSVRKRLAQDLERLQKAYFYAGVVNVFLAVVLAGNGGLDKSPTTPVHTTVLRKQVTRGRSGPSYTVAVPSWRPGKSTEVLSVNAQEFRSVSVGKGAIVEMHRGAFGLPWYSGVFSE